MKREFNEEFKKDFMKMQVGEDWNKLKEKYKNISQFQWDKQMQKHFDELIGKYSSFEDYRKRQSYEERNIKLLVEKIKQLLIF